MEISQLPYLDEHSRSVAADSDAVWLALSHRLDRMLPGALASGYARLVGSPDHVASGPRPLEEGSVVPGFRVVRATPGAELVLLGRHHFATYALTFRIEPEHEQRCRLTAESRASFPGPAGGLYRLLVIGTRGHVLVVHLLLSRIATDAEAR